ncbi:galectin-8-like [Clavelina lepadiformis]|uniref:galectin-8-like n=1 Tax=Clavelina lepadiformis TaxID=159417 RepID=UPI0040433345
MHLSLSLISFLVATCIGQDSFTCRRSDQEQNVVPIQGIPGKRGPVGLKGSKGEPGVADDNEVDFIKSQLVSLQQQLEALRKKPTNCSEVNAPDRTNGFYETSAYIGCSCRLEFCDFSSPGERKFWGSHIRLPFDSFIGHSVVIIGKPTADQWFVINLFLSTDFLNLHFKAMPSQNWIVRNTFANGAWGHEERDLGVPYPFALNRQFKLKFSVNEGGFRVYLDDAHLLNYAHRHRSWTDIKFFHAHGAVSIERMWVE